MNGKEQAPAQRAALVTGGGRGIGRSIARALAADGFAVVVNDLPDSPDLAETVAMIRADGGIAHPLPADIALVEDHAALVEQAFALAGGIDCLVNNAGIAALRRGDLFEVSPAQFDRLITVNLRAPFFLSQEVARRMTMQPSGRFRSIITVSSISAEIASVDRAEYCIAKSGLAMLTQLFALRLAPHGIRVYEIRPGVIATPMTAQVKDRYDRRYEEGFTPINRWGQPDEVGRAAAMLASGTLPFSTGEAVRVDGGLHMRSF
ncbi:3-ketoacyl-ACP reductase [Geminicoccus roseus]|uniref:3-ketoacyl-ACP reductase n=1 Tax=Geminicoccus roseus TaxID=404900 RepID=UPI0004285D37|nr:3-ketoacyl-ACP reductase [Geminicoccus roseus]